MTQPAFVPSIEQSNFLAAVQDSLECPLRQPVVLQARAGTGKTRTIQYAIESLRATDPSLRILYLVFNKKNQMEAEQKLARFGVECLTLNSFGGRAVSRAYRATVKADAAYVAIDEAEAKLPRAKRLTGDERGDCHKLLSLGRQMLAENAGDLANVAASFDLGPGKDSNLSMEEFLATAGRAMRSLDQERSVVDFDDQIWLPVWHNLRVAQYDVVFVDEAQDLSPCKLALARMAVKPNGLFVAVGDDRQAIYGFAGADPDSLPRIIRETQARVLPLTVTYRCPKAVVFVARGIVGDYTAHPSAPEGIVRHTSSLTLVSQLTAGDAVVSRSNAPLVALCLRLLAAGTSAKVLGRNDVADGLKKLIKKAKTDDVGDLLHWVSEWADAECLKLSKANRSTDAVEDKRDCLFALSDGCGSVEALLGRIEALFTDVQEGRYVLLTSTHKAKGLEWDRVYLLADTYRADKSPDPQEANLLYVGITRAKNELVMVSG